MIFLSIKVGCSVVYVKSSLLEKSKARKNQSDKMFRDDTDKMNSYATV